MSVRKNKKVGMQNDLRTSHSFWGNTAISEKRFSDVFPYTVQLFLR
jgi:hypothetical protein